MTYGDKLVYGVTEHIESKDGGPLCGIKSMYTGAKCRKCLTIYNEAADKLNEWNEAAKPYTPGTAWNWNNAPGFDKNKNRKRR